ncbi:MAG: MBL fold metallo-hydrolase [Pseudomonadota bacterium]
MIAALDAPKRNEIEVSVFGKGIGECSVVHIGNGKWVVVDSFLDDSGVPIARSYLEKLGFGGNSIELVVLTHWHDDHIKGASSLLSWAPEALVSYPSVLSQDEFRAAIQRASPAAGTAYTSGVHELARVSSALKERPDTRRLALSQRTIYESELAKVITLSPSDEDIELFLNEISNWPTANDVVTVLKKPNRNDTSVATLIDIDGTQLLFGADLEIRGELSGWQAVHDLYWNGRPPCSFYKIAHHGSPNAHYIPKWRNMLQNNVYAVLTPYGRGRTPRPSNDDVTRINSETQNGFSAGRTNLMRSRREHNSVRRTLSDASIELKRICQKLGHVRLRLARGELEWRSDLIGEAVQLAP